MCTTTVQPERRPSTAVGSNPHTSSASMTSAVLPRYSLADVEALLTQELHELRCESIRVAALDPIASTASGASQKAQRILRRKQTP